MALPENSERLSISLPSWLFQLIQDHCDSRGMTVSGFLQVAAKQHLLSIIENKKLWKHIYHEYVDAS